MNDNIFIREKKDKYNPDIMGNTKNKERERKNTKFDLSTQIYNPITNIVPQTIKNQKDLQLTKDENISNMDIKKLIAQKERERYEQELKYKPTKQRIMSNEETRTTNNIMTFNELKKTADINNVHQQNKNKYDNILEGLKDLGILKK